MITVEILCDHAKRFFYSVACNIPSHYIDILLSQCSNNDAKGISSNNDTISTISCAIVSHEDQAQGETSSINTENYQVTQPAQWDCHNFY